MGEFNETPIVTIIDIIVGYFDELKTYFKDEFTYYISQIRGEKNEMNEIWIKFQINPSSPVLTYTKTFQSIEENKDQFSHYIFRLIRENIEEYRLQSVSIEINQFNLAVTCVLIPL